MSYVTRRRHGWEVRETVATERGPRSRTLATFKRLDGTALDRARTRASKPIDSTALIKSALRAGAPVDPSEADAHAEALIRQLVRGTAPRPALRRLLAGYLDGGERPPGDDSGIAEWLGRSMSERGAALVDLLLLADAIPAPPAPRELSFPGLGGGGE
jgi:hypothetical protein